MSGVSGNHQELWRLRFGATAPADHDPHILWVDQSASPPIGRVWNGATWESLAGGGGGGAVSGTYVHTQLTPAATWTINHALAKFPAVAVVDSGGTVVEGDVAYPSDGTVVVSFSAPFGGVAYLN